MKSLQELVVDVVRAITRETVFHGLYQYEVLSDTTEESRTTPGMPQSVPAGLVSLRNISGVPGLPDALEIDKAHGLPGAWSVLQPKTIALVGFQNGVPSRPYVALYLPNQPRPLDTGMDAENTITLGMPGSAVPLAKAGMTDFNFVAVAAKVKARNAEDGPLAVIEPAPGSYVKFRLDAQKKKK